MKGYESYVQGTQQTPYVNLKGWRDNCLLMHPNWVHMFWDETSARQLITEHYAWFLPTWNAYDREIARADVVRVFALHHYGGLYLDLDVQCFRNVRPFLRGYDVVLQGSTEEWDKGTINCAMASVPQHPLWLAYAQILPETQKQSSNFAATGPAALARAVASYYGTAEPIAPGTYKGPKGDASVLKVYPVGEWYVPCMGNGSCNGELVKKLVIGDAFPKLAGYHRFQGTWYAPPHEDAWVHTVT
ncbi:hypothetical protein WJX72_003325 [[Myrmecia] bisecta]|uniref:Uncharacterized protein n=1 Tax=[Myrmecia] bisecta TaxID=41462 RepID=A0AAW1P2Q9_9CHLO